MHPRVSTINLKSTGKVKLKSTGKVKLKSTASEDEFYPYAIIFEFFKTHFAEQMLTRETSKPEQLEHLFNRQVHLMNNVMRPDHRIWKKCAFQCNDEICTLEELRAYHDE